jgi:hypothetical protein
MKGHGNKTSVAGEGSALPGVAFSRSFQNERLTDRGTAHGYETGPIQMAMAPASYPALQKTKTLPYPRPVTDLVRDPQDVYYLREAPG